MRPVGAVLAVAFLLLAGTFVTSVAQPVAAGDATGMYGGNLSVAVQGLAGLDPRTAGPADKRVLELVYDQLGRVDPTSLEIQPWAATGWEQTGDKNITVTLRNDLRWSDNTPITAADVAYSLGQYKKGPTSRWTVHVVDATTIRIDFTRFDATNWTWRASNDAGPGLFFTEGLTASIAWKNLATQMSYSGPFAVAANGYTPDPVPGDEVPAGFLNLTANPYYFAGRPYLDRVSFRWPYTAVMTPTLIGTDIVLVSRGDDAGCALMFREVNLIGWALLANDLTNTRDCVAKFGGFAPLAPADSLFDLGTVNITGATVSSVVVNLWCRRMGTIGVDVETVIKVNGTVYSGAAFDCPDSSTYGTTNTTYTSNPFTGVAWTQKDLDDLQAGCRHNDLALPLREVRCSEVKVVVSFVQPGPAAAILLPEGNGDSTDWIVSGTAGCADQASQWTCVKDEPNDGDTTYILSKDGTKKALLNPDPKLSQPFILPAKNPGPDLLYFGFTYNTNSIFAGAPGSEGQKLRSALYWFVNKGTYQNTEGVGSSRITHGPINRLDTPWAPAECAPFSPCEAVVDPGFTGQGETSRTDTAPGKLAMLLGGFFDRDGDGWRDLSTGQQIQFQILAPSFMYDPKKTTIADDYTNLLRSQASLNVSRVVYDTPAEFDAAVAACQASGSCISIQRYSAATILPDWLYGMPDVAAANDPDVDLHLNLGSRLCYDEACRALHVGHVSHYIGANADFLPVLNYETLEAYDTESFTGWQDMFGGVTNFWTYMGLHRPAAHEGAALTTTVAIAPTRTVVAGGTTQVVVTVRDDLGFGIADAEVELTASSGTLGAYTGTTDGGGGFQTTYTAPSTVAEVADVQITADVSKAQYAGASAMGTLTVHPPGLGTLTVTVDRGPSAIIGSHNSTTVTVTVEDAATGVGVPGATVSLTANLPGATIEPATGLTNGAGVFTAQFTADVTQGMQYVITADASAAGYGDGTQSTSLSVTGDFSVTIPQVRSVRNVPGFEAAYALVAVAAVFALVAVARRRREG